MYPFASPASNGLDTIHPPIVDIKVRGKESQRTQLDDIANYAHNEEANANCLRDLDEFSLIRCGCVSFDSLLHD